VAVAGIPRSGVLAAALLALERNIHLISLNDVERGSRAWEFPLRRNVPGRKDGRVLVVDDSINSGESIREVWQELHGVPHLIFGAVYYTADASAALVECVFRRVESPRCFEWNVFHSNQMQYTCIDMDGVLCEDFPHREEDNGEGLVRYRKHLAGAAPRFLPTSYPVLAIVTSRLEKYRAETEDWLRRHGIQYGRLMMSPHATAAARREAADQATMKASFYSSAMSARLFIESDPQQAADIATLSRRPVLCVDGMRMFAGS
jgi:uncharacterized HAD superfamily protein